MGGIKLVNLGTAEEWVTKIGVEGRLDATTSPEFEQAIEPILDHDLDYLVLDLSKVPFISSAGIRALMYVNKALAKKDAKVMCINMQPQIAAVMETIKQLPGLHVFANDAEMDQYVIKIQNEVLKRKRK